ncbi:hypothetical protein CEXT_675601 [Caerostris extrusa]|uniref:Uncharacterized protein n=1 Tax=Caerostris extrusa TaxID=172846 RepID=A0AAV4QLY0_CAEEX|nr:hypothetical protein CEXT_675601 [Caerostris extrusa]
MLPSILSGNPKAWFWKRERKKSPQARSSELQILTFPFLSICSSSRMAVCSANPTNFLHGAVIAGPAVKGHAYSTQVHHGTTLVHKAPVLHAAPLVHAAACLGLLKVSHVAAAPAVVAHHAAPIAYGSHLVPAAAHHGAVLHAAVALHPCPPRCCSCRCTLHHARALTASAYSSKINHVAPGHVYAAPLAYAAHAAPLAHAHAAPIAYAAHAAPLAHAHAAPIAYAAPAHYAVNYKGSPLLH